MQLGFYFDQTRCTGCCACIVACKDKNNVEAGSASWRRVTTIDKGTFPDLFTAFLSLSCCHCGKPVCVDVCPVNALTKKAEDGVVTVDQELCIGCKLCLEVCAYNGPQFGDDDDMDSKMQKCDFCSDRLVEGKKPVCVGSCPMRALDAGPIKELKAKYGNITQAEGFTYAEELSPSIIFKPKKDARGLVLQRVEVVPLSPSLLSGKPRLSLDRSHCPHQKVADLGTTPLSEEGEQYL